MIIMCSILSLNHSLGYMLYFSIFLASRDICCIISSKRRGIIPLLGKGLTLIWSISLSWRIDHVLLMIYHLGILCFFFLPLSQSDFTSSSQFSLQDSIYLNCCGFLGIFIIFRILAKSLRFSSFT
jgi:hypothetical protein